MRCFLNNNHLTFSYASLPVNVKKTVSIAVLCDIPFSDFVKNQLM